MSTLKPEQLREAYIVQGKSDREIAEEHGLTRSAISHMRKKYGIATRMTSANWGHNAVHDALIAKGYSVRDMRKKSKTTRFNFLVDRVLKIQVFTATAMNDGKWRFTLTRSEKTGIKAAEKYYKKLPCGRLRKNVETSSDVVILCGKDKEDCKLFIVPPSVIPENISTITITIYDGKWHKWLWRWDVIEKIRNHKRPE